MLWWALGILGLTVLVLYAMAARRHIAFLGTGALLTALGGLGVAGVLGGQQENPLEAIARGLQGASLTQPAPNQPSPPTTPNPGLSSTPPPADPGSSGTTSTDPSSSNPGSSGTTSSEPTPPPATPEPTPPAAPEQPSPPPAATEPAPPSPVTSEPAPTPPAADTNSCPCTLEVSTNSSVAAIKLQRDTGELLASSGTPAKFENLPVGTYTITVEATGTGGYTGTVTLPQTRTLSVYLER